MDKCTTCGMGIVSTWNYCPQCGASLNQAETIWRCPKCNSEFEDDGKEHPNGILCPECKQRGYTLVGVLQKIKRYGEKL